jgi:hypothetical protein
MLGEVMSTASDAGSMTCGEAVRQRDVRLEIFQRNNPRTFGYDYFFRPRSQKLTMPQQGFSACK